MSFRGASFAAVLLVACAAPKPPAPFERALKRGERLEREGERGEAASAYGHAIARCGNRPPDCALARYRRARMLDRTGDREGAMAEYLRAADADPQGSYRGQAWLYAARIAVRLGRADADRLYERVIFERAFEGVAGRALRERLMREPEGGRLAWIRSVEPRLRATELGDHALWLEAGLEAEGDPRAERTTLETLVERYPYPRAQLWDEALWRLADLSLAAGDAGAAIRWLTELADAYETSHLVGSYALPKMDDAALRIVILQLEVRRDPAAAEAAAVRLLDCFEDSELRDDALFLQARARRARGDCDGACETMSALRDDYPHSKYLRHERRESAGLRCGR